MLLQIIFEALMRDMQQTNRNLQKAQLNMSTILKLIR